MTEQHYSWHTSQNRNDAGLTKWHLAKSNGVVYITLWRDDDGLIHCKGIPETFVELDKAKAYVENLYMDWLDRINRNTIRKEKEWARYQVECDTYEKWQAKPFWKRFGERMDKPSLPSWYYPGVEVQEVTMK